MLLKWAHLQGGCYAYRGERGAASGDRLRPRTK